MYLPFTIIHAGGNVVVVFLTRWSVLFTQHITGVTLGFDLTHEIYEMECVVSTMLMC